MKKNCGHGSIYDMGMVQLNGKKSTQIAREYGVTPNRVRQYALEHDLPFVSSDGGKTVDFYLFDEATEKKFANRRLKSPGRPFVPKPPKVPGKPGRPRKEKPVNTGPKRPVGRPRKNPAEAMAVVPRSKKSRTKSK